MSVIERQVARLLHRWLVRRGWVVQVNTPSRCHDYHEEDGRLLDGGWRPLFSIRYGKTPVYRGVGEYRWKQNMADDIVTVRPRVASNGSQP